MGDFGSLFLNKRSISIDWEDGNEEVGRGGGWAELYLIERLFEVNVKCRGLVKGLTLTDGC